MLKIGGLAALALVTLVLASACGGGAPEDSLDRFVSAINDADFNDAYEEFVPACQEEMSLKEFEATYGVILLDAGVGRGGAFGATTLKAEDVTVTRVGDREAQIVVDWVLYTSIDNPLPFLGKVLDETVPLNTVLDVSGTADRPLNAIDMTGSGDWRIDDCDPLGLEKAVQDTRDLYEDIEYYYGQLED